MATTENKVINRSYGERANHPSAASKTHYEGAAVFLASGLATDVVNTGSNKFAGIAVEQVDNSAGAASDKNVEVWRKGLFKLPVASLVIGSVGSDVYATDNYTFTLVSTDSTKIGKVVGYVSAGVGWVDIEGVAV